LIVATASLQMTKHERGVVRTSGHVNH